MGAHATLQVSRAAAIELVLKSMGMEMSDAYLQEKVDEILDPMLYNCRIVERDGADDDQVMRMDPPGAGSNSDPDPYRP